MPLNIWLTRQIDALEKHIRESEVFTSRQPPTPEELMDLKRMIVTRSFLLHELIRRGEKPAACSCDDMNIAGLLGRQQVVAEVQERT